MGGAISAGKQQPPHRKKWDFVLFGKWGAARSSFALILGTIQQALRVGDKRGGLGAASLGGDRFKIHKGSLQEIASVHRYYERSVLMLLVLSQRASIGMSDRSVLCPPVTSVIVRAGLVLVSVRRSVFVYG
ncbi:hypothetical protein LR48_Vigan03g032300 [Vigna angularis]|uniref:Uncharacterized protein n=1 Tax=Phaseolus angularis TaxID=3914 RepID=A0A0L9U2Q9_PHAAN|nr:hypothetical protein LR48_Vigan03g032300 [Vigna angularis]